MSLITPDDFRNDPYTAGINQLGHVVFGAALATVLPLVVALLAILALELFQLERLGGRKADYFQDVMFWGVGVFMYNHDMLPVVAVCLGGLWMGVVWLRMKLN